MSGGEQLLQNLSSGKTEIIDEPVPRTKSGHVLDKTRDQKSKSEARDRK